MQLYVGCILFVLISTISAEIYFEERFKDDSWENDWIYSKHPDKELGKFKLTSGAFYNDAEADKGIQTSQDARFYAISRKFKPFSNANKDLVIQFTVKHEQNIDCGGGYVKIFDCALEQEAMHGESPYLIMFGPDICGPGTKKVHAIINYKGQNLMMNREVRCKDDVYTHLYTFIIKPNNTYQILIDNEEAQSGDLEADWSFLPPKKIKDPNESKPDDWEDKPTIPDPDDKKPDDWDKPEHIQDPEATKPEDWDDEMDGEWEAPMIDNPEYKGEWKPKQIDNPKYKGPWVHPEIDNPDYKKDPDLYKKDEICIIGFDLWQVKSGTIFSNIMITDDIKAAHKFGEDVWKPMIEGEKKMKEAQDEEERKQREKDSPSTDASKEDDEDEDDDEDGDKNREEHDEL